jgi:hypothetical protein
MRSVQSWRHCANASRTRGHAHAAGFILEVLDRTKKKDILALPQQDRHLPRRVLA